jgi:hypothetical protein
MRQIPSMPRPALIAIVGSDIVAPGADVIDATGLIAMPGLNNRHFDPQVSLMGQRPPAWAGKTAVSAAAIAAWHLRWEEAIRTAPRHELTSLYTREGAEQTRELHTISHELAIDISADFFAR